MAKTTNWESSKSSTLQPVYQPQSLLQTGYLSLFLSSKPVTHLKSSHSKSPIDHRTHKRDPCRPNPQSREIQRPNSNSITMRKVARQALQAPKQAGNGTMQRNRRATLNSSLRNDCRH